MSALGQKQTLQCLLVMSALPPKADIGRVLSDVCVVPIADIALLRAFSALGEGETNLKAPAVTREAEELS